MFVPQVETNRFSTLRSNIHWATVCGGKKSELKQSGDWNFHHDKAQPFLNKNDITPVTHTLISPAPYLNYRYKKRQKAFYRGH